MGPYLFVVYVALFVGTVISADKDSFLRSGRLGNNVTFYIFFLTILQPLGFGNFLSISLGFILLLSSSDSLYWQFGQV